MKNFVDESRRQIENACEEVQRKSGIFEEIRNSLI